MLVPDDLASFFYNFFLISIMSNITSYSKITPLRTVSTGVYVSMTVADYIRDYPERLHSKIFSYMKKTWAKFFVRNSNGEDRLKRFGLCSVVGVTGVSPGMFKLSSSDTRTYTPLMRACKEL